MRLYQTAVSPPDRRRRVAVLLSRKGHKTLSLSPSLSLFAQVVDLVSPIAHVALIPYDVKKERTWCFLLLFLLEQYPPFTLSPQPVS